MEANDDVLALGVALVVGLAVVGVVLGARVGLLDEPQRLLAGGAGLELVDDMERPPIKRLPLLMARLMTPP